MSNFYPNTLQHDGVQQAASMQFLPLPPHSLGLMMRLHNFPLVVCLGDRFSQLLLMIRRTVCPTHCSKKAFLLMSSPVPAAKLCGLIVKSSGFFQLKGEDRSPGRRWAEACSGGRWTNERSRQEDGEEKRAVRQEQVTPEHPAEAVWAVWVVGKYQQTQKEGWQ